MSDVLVVSLHCGDCRGSRCVSDDCNEPSLFDQVSAFLGVHRACTRPITMYLVDAVAGVR